MLYIIATPIGNLEDITLRALRILGEVDLVLAEDTRKTGLLLKHFGIKKPILSFFERNEIKRIPYIISQLQSNKSIALVSNAGTPSICDPGYKLIRECRRLSLPVVAIPGVSVITASLSISSIGHDKFIFLGYLPRKKNERIKLLEEIKNYNLTFIFFESPYRLVSSLTDIREIFGNRRINIIRELTKKFEEVLDLQINYALKHFENTPPKGEFTVIVDKA